MAEIRKFLFDNFVIGGKSDTKIPDPLPEITEEEIIVEQPEEIIEEANEIPEEDIIQDEVYQEPEETFSKEELDAKVLIAEQAGYEKGYAAAVQEQTVENNKLLADISQKLSVLLSQTNKEQMITEDEAAQLIRQALQTLVPTLLEDNAATLVSKFLQDNFNNFKHNEKLSFYIHPDIISYAQESIVKLANSNDFEGKIAIHKDSGLDKSSCRVEWSNGGVEYQPAEQLKQVEQMFDK